MSEFAPLPHMVVNFNNRQVATIRKGFHTAQEAVTFVHNIVRNWRKPHGQDFEIYPDTEESLKSIEERSVAIHYLTPYHS